MSRSMPTGRWTIVILQIVMERNADYWTCYSPRRWRGHCTEAFLFIGQPEMYPPWSVVLPCRRGEEAPRAIVTVSQRRSSGNNTMSWRTAWSQDSILLVEAVTAETTPLHGRKNCPPPSTEKFASGCAHPTNGVDSSRRLKKAQK